ncbi:hypothetical protein DBR32_03800 [Taibaiella sp. KBW10]|uniref:glycosyltransferase n=1 Tax=Taibaiella sp. KBW10 TaxID=2153357 RepID=UPI000F59E12F|nr:glycosyltransferase [Taibaiella sp. KBW10]RQO31940.1 hypothetical protein DBR32_03800 [Taibaiella sp. KBW10]
MIKNILIISTGDINGAYDAAYKLATIAINMGHNVKMLVKYKSRPDHFIVQYPQPVLTLGQRALLKINNKIKKNEPLRTDSEYGFLSINETVQNVDVALILKTIGFKPDYIFVGMTIQFMNTTDLYNLSQKANAQVVNVTVDMNHFTGGCHFSWGCKGYVYGCNEECPAIIAPKDKIIAKHNFERKLLNATNGNFQILAGSGLTLEQAKESKIYKNQKYIENINSLIDMKIFNDNNKQYAKKVFGLNEDKFYILAGSQTTKERRKGFSFLIEALKELELLLTPEYRSKIILLVVSREVTHVFDEINFQTQHLDYIKDHRLLSQLYQAADVFVNTSIEDSGPMMVSEALACGTPVVGFDTGIVTNMVIDDYNGYKIRMKNSKELALGINKIFDLSKDDYATFSKNSVRQVQEYSSFEYAESILNKIIFRNL